MAYEADNTETTYYYGAEGLAAQYNSGTGKYYAYHYDNIGSTTLITARDGHAVERFSYGTYGELLKEPITKIRFLYNGSYGVATDSNGLYYMRARYYNSDIKRFINQDIKVGDIGSSQSLNRYAYCEGNPVSMVDPFGLCGEDANDQGEKSKYQWLHNALDWAGLVFDGADIVNGILYAAEGDYVNAAISFACGIPAVGNIVAGVAKTSKVAKAMKTANKIADMCKSIGKAGNTAAGMKAAYDTYQTAQRECNTTSEKIAYMAGTLITGYAAGKAASWGANKLKNLANKALPKLKTAVQEGAGKLANRISKGFSSSGSGRMKRNRGFVVNPFYKGGSTSDLLLKAEKARDDLIISTTGGKKKSMVIGAYDIKTGDVVADFAGPIPDEISPVLIERANKIGGIGSTGLTDRNTIGVCAEFRTANQLLLNGSDISNIRFTKPIRPRTGEVRPNCANCLEMFSDILDN